MYLYIEDLLAFQERIPTATAEPRTDVQAMLEAPESRHLEVKGSLYLNWRRWLASDEEQPVSDEEILNDGLVKAVVGMLNAEGGHVVVGALEAHRFSTSASETDSPLAGAERVGDYLIVGVDGEKHFATGGWDGLRLHIQDVLTSRIDPSPAGLINVTPARLGARTLAVIRVQPSATTWFYRFLGTDKPVRFFVREDGRTVTYTGSDADNYKRARPRG